MPSSAASTEPGVQARAPGACEDQPPEQQQEQDLWQVEELEQPELTVSAKGEVVDNHYGPFRALDNRKKSGEYPASFVNAL